MTTNSTLQTKSVLLAAKDWACNDPKRPGVCFAVTPRAATEYQALQEAINARLLGEGMSPIPITGTIDQATRDAVKLFVRESGKRPYSNIQVTPWVFAELILAGM